MYLRIPGKDKIAKKIDDDHVDSLVVDLDKSKDDKITLSFILNIIDGIRETPGRILIITSNNYNCLDPALIRPGRIDINLETIIPPVHDSAILIDNSLLIQY